MGDFDLRSHRPVQQAALTDSGKFFFLDCLAVSEGDKR